MVDGCSINRKSSYVVYAYLLPYIISKDNFSFGLQNLIYTKICHNRYHDYELCSNSTFTKGHPNIQEDAGKWQNYATITELVPAVAIVILLSSYCDKIGYKFPIIMSALALLLALCWCTLTGAKEFVEWPMYSCLLAPLLFGLGGAYVVMYMSSVGYISLITEYGRREYYLSGFYAVKEAGQLIGHSTQRLIIEAFGQVTFFVISAALQLLALLIIVCLMVDIERPGRDTVRPRDVISCDSYKEAAVCVFRKREGYGRTLLQLSITVYMFVVFCNDSKASVEYLYFIKELGMTPKYYSVFRSCMGILQVVMPLTLLPFCQKVLKLENRTIAMFAVASIAISFILFAQGEMWCLWAAIVIGSPHTIFYGLMQNFNVQMVQKNEVGKMFAYIHLVQLILGYLGQIASKAIYINTLTVWPGAVFLVLCSIDLVAMLLLVLLEKFSRKHDLALFQGH